MMTALLAKTAHDDHAESAMSTAMTPEAPPSRAEWLGLVERIEEAERLAAKDESLQALAELTAAEDEAAALMARAVGCGVRWASEAGKTWAEISSRRYRCEGSSSGVAPLD